jgi:hypothetical protein
MSYAHDKKLRKKLCTVVENNLLEIFKEYGGRI